MSHVYSKQFTSAEEDMDSLYKEFLEGSARAGVEILVLASLFQATADAVQSLTRKSEAKNLAQFTLDELITKTK